PRSSACTFSSSPPRDPRDLHSFPTRRSSDLAASECTSPPHPTAAACGRTTRTPRSRRTPAPSTPTPQPPESRRPESRTPTEDPEDRKSTRLNSSHVKISYAVFCLKKKKKR